ncbi:HNH endonuclease [Larkinella soli]|uniref:HNH endonuclease n=1 Tax=Larkinella soli TaxID=1770527 RepID=UPI000FFBAC3B|nr:HNH endonuclease [Larkinella soli]
MNYWRVNHKQTFKSEIEGEYIWSPKNRQNGSRNLFYENLTKVRIGDKVFSYAGQAIKAIGVATQTFEIAKRPPEFGNIGNQWDDEGWLVRINWILLNKPIKPKQYINGISPLLPKKYSPIQVNGNGNQACYLAEISDDLASLLLRLISINNLGLLQEVDFATRVVEDVIEVEQIINAQIRQTEKDQLIKARVGQGIFRSRVLEIEKCCRLTEISNETFLIASHIKPWKESNSSEKLDKYNGLMLTPHVDKLFDKMLISFTNQGDILVAEEWVTDLMKKCGLDPKKNVGPFYPEQQVYLEFHRDRFYERQRLLHPDSN